MNKGYSLETLYRVYNDTNGSRIEVKPDGDCLGLIEISRRDSANTPEAHLTVTKEEAILLAEVLMALANKSDRHLPAFS